MDIRSEVENNISNKLGYYSTGLYMFITELRNLSLTNTEDSINQDIGMQDSFWDFAPNILENWYQESINAAKFLLSYNYSEEELLTAITYIKRLDFIEEFLVRMHRSDDSDLISEIFRSKIFELTEFFLCKLNEYSAVISSERSFDSLLGKEFQSFLTDSNAYFLNIKDLVMIYESESEDYDLITSLNILSLICLVSSDGNELSKFLLSTTTVGLTLTSVIKNSYFCLRELSEFGQQPVKRKRFWLNRIFKTVNRLGLLNHH